MNLAEEILTWGGTKAFCEKETTNKYSNINNNKSRNTNDNDRNDDNVKFLMTKTLIIVIVEELVIITITTVIKLTDRRDSMERENKQANKQTWLD